MFQYLFINRIYRVTNPQTACVFRVVSFHSKALMFWSNPCTAEAPELTPPQVSWFWPPACVSSPCPRDTFRCVPSLPPQAVQQGISGERRGSAAVVVVVVAVAFAVAVVVVVVAVAVAVVVVVAVAVAGGGVVVVTHSSSCGAENYLYQYLVQQPNAGN